MMRVNRFIYPRTIKVTRPYGPRERNTPAVGKQPYQGLRRDAEETELLEVPATIQNAGSGRGKGADTPSDAYALASWKILLPPDALPRDAITERDVVTDELGKRYQIDAAYWSPLGFNLRATLLQA